MLPSNLRRAVEGLTVPIRDILKVEYGPVFEPEEVASLTAAFDAALSNLGLVNRKDPITTTVAKVIIQLAKDGERDRWHRNRPWTLRSRSRMPRCWECHRAVATDMRTARLE